MNASRSALRKKKSYSTRIIVTILTIVSILIGSSVAINAKEEREQAREEEREIRDKLSEKIVLFDQVNRRLKLAILNDVISEKNEFITNSSHLNKQTIEKFDIALETMQRYFKEDYQNRLSYCSSAPIGEIYNIKNELGKLLHLISNERDKILTDEEFADLKNQILEHEASITLRIMEYEEIAQKKADEEKARIESLEESTAEQWSEEYHEEDVVDDEYY